MKRFDFAEDVVAAILENNPDIERLKIVETLEGSYSLGHYALANRVFAERLDEAHSAAQEAAEIARKWRISFATALLGVALSRNKKVSNEAAKALKQHNVMSTHSEIHSANWPEEINRLLAAKKTRGMLALSSLVKCRGGKTAHIPMLDLGCDSSASGKASALSAIHTIGVEGYLLNSGKSFHFYGKYLMKSREFTKFLGNAALFSPIIDAAWIAHQLIEGAAALRLNKKLGYKRRPYLVCEI